MLVQTSWLGQRSRVPIRPIAVVRERPLLDKLSRLTGPWFGEQAKTNAATGETYSERMIHICSSNVIKSSFEPCATAPIAR
jgi:hypothetical protein